MVRVAAQLLSSHLAAIGHALARIPRSAWHPVQMDCLLQRSAAAKQREVAAIGEFLGWHAAAFEALAAGAAKGGPSAEAENVQNAQKRQKM